ncbi:MAG TPA: V-type ATP synthase subunit A [Acidimicrobiia bacterium]
MSAEMGRVVRVAGPVVVAEGLERARLYSLVRVGRRGLVGEVIRLVGDQTVIQVYEETSGLRVGSTVVDTGAPLSVELGPGLIGAIFDGVQRPLPVMAGKPGGPVTEPFVRRGMDLPGLPRDRRWPLAYRVEPGNQVTEGDILLTVSETVAVEHRILVPPGRGGKVVRVGEAEATVTDPVVWLDDGEEPLTMLTRWPVRRRRPVAGRLDPTEPLVTGQRVVDVLFPVAKGGSATIPGGFGTGKTVHEQTLAKYADADIVIFIGCGERGNELAEVLEEFPRLTDPATGAALIERTVIIANTSNMPVAAREASIYTGITIGEYFRDQGYDVALLADSTSRWGEALREVSSRLEEMPGEEGYPAYLPSRLAEFYERSGAVVALGADERRGSVTVVGAVSPPGGDFSEPVTQYSLRLAGTFWALDAELARGRHFPAIHWTRSYSLYDTAGWFDRQVDPSWSEHVVWVQGLLGRAEELEDIVQLLGTDVLAPEERITFAVARLVHEDFLQQSAYDPVDAFCPLNKQLDMLRVIRRFHDLAVKAVAADTPVEKVMGMGVVGEMGRMRSWPHAEAADRSEALIERLEAEVGAS